MSNSSGLNFENIKKETLGDTWMTIYHPKTGADTGARIKLAGPDSSVYRQAEEKIKNQGLKRMGKNKNLSLSTVELEEVGLGFLVQVTLDWENVFYGEQPLEFSEANVRTLYKDFFWLREQVDEFLGDRRNFFSD